MEMNLVEFVSKYNGKKIDWDGAYQGQCVDLFRQYVHEVLALSQPKSVSGAADFWTNYDTDPVLKNNFDKIANSETFVPQAGDVGLWNKRAGGGFGHVGVCTGKGDTTFFESFDQNWKTISVCELINHNYTNFYGVLRPKRQPEDISSELAECNIHKNNLQTQVNGLLKDIEAQKGVISDTETKLGTANGRIQELIKQNEDLSQKLGSANGTIKALTEKIESQNNIIGEFQKEDAVQIQTLRDSYDAQKIAESRLSDLLWEFEDSLKLPHTINDMTERISVVVGALQSQIQTNISYQKQVTELEAQVKKLNTQKLPIAKLTQKQLILELLNRLLKRS